MLLFSAAVLRDRQEIITRKMSAEELRSGVGDDDRRTREMTPLERDELLAIESRELDRIAESRPVAAARPRRPTARTARLRSSMIAMKRPALPRSKTARIVAAIASTLVIAIVIGVMFR
jgi:hypothetical protein